MTSYEKSDAFSCIYSPDFFSVVWLSDVPYIMKLFRGKKKVKMPVLTKVVVIQPKCNQDINCDLKTF